MTQVSPRLTGSEAREQVERTVLGSLTGVSVELLRLIARGGAAGVLIS